MLLLIFSFLAGLATVLSPCVLPVLPAILAAGTTKGRLRSLGVVTGLVISFTFFTLTLGAIIEATGISPNFLRYAAIAIIALFGLIMIFPSLSNLFTEKTARIADMGTKIQSKSSSSSGFFGGFILGIALGLVWTPCAGPILGSVISLAASHALSFDLLLITLAYAIGSAVPMFLIMIGGNKALTSSRFLSKYAEKIRQGFGVLMIATALGLVFHIDETFQQMALNYLPSISTENNSFVNQELEKLRGNRKILSSQLPPFIGVTKWINSPPLTPENLKGKVVLVDFWTYSCINCIRTFPYLKSWYKEYGPNGLVIVGVHTPEFAFEKDPKNVEEATKRFGIEYPVAMDNHYEIWNSYGNHYWPAHYLFDQDGQFVEKHFGEGAYVETENSIRKLLGLSPLVKSEPARSYLPMTPETYLGYDKADQYLMTTYPDVTFDYKWDEPVSKNQVALNGKWKISNEALVSESDQSSLTLNFEATRVYLVMSSEEPALVTVMLDGKPLPEKYRTDDMDAEGKIKVQTPRKYDILNLQMKYSNHLLTLIIPKGVKLFAFTFGNEP